MQPRVENAFIHESERSRTSAVWNFRLRSLTTLVILIGLGLQIGVAVESGGDYEIWVSPESFVFVSVPWRPFVELKSFANCIAAWNFLDLEHCRVPCPIHQEERNSPRRPCRARSDPLDGTVQFRTCPGSDKLLVCAASRGWGIEVSWLV